MFQVNVWIRQNNFQEHKYKYERLIYPEHCYFNNVHYVLTQLNVILKIIVNLSQ